MARNVCVKDDANTAGPQAAGRAAPARSARRIAREQPVSRSRNGLYSHQREAGRPITNPY
jgi:hypothetical protein